MCQFTSIGLQQAKIYKLHVLKKKVTAIKFGCEQSKGLLSYHFNRPFPHLSTHSHPTVFKRCDEKVGFDLWSLVVKRKSTLFLYLTEGIHTYIYISFHFLFLFSFLRLHHFWKLCWRQRQREVKGLSVGRIFTLLYYYLFLFYVIFIFYLFIYNK